MKKITIVFSVLLILLLASCDLFITPKRGRENPLDTKCPVYNFSVMVINGNSLEIAWDSPADGYDNDEAPKAYGLVIKNGSKPADIYNSELKYWVRNDWSNPFNWDNISDEINNEDTYYVGVFWTYDDTGENDWDQASWAGPVVAEPVKFMANEARIDVDYDLYVDSIGGTYNSNDSLYVYSYGYQETSLIKFNDIPAGRQLVSASLALYVFESPATFDMTATVGRIETDWDESTTGWDLWNGICMNDTHVAVVESKINIPMAFSPGWISYDAWFVNDWYNQGQPAYGIRLKAENEYVKFTSSDLSNAAYHPYLIVRYFGDPIE